MRISPSTFRRDFFDDYFLLRGEIRRRIHENAPVYPNVACYVFDNINSEIMMFGRFERTSLDVVFSKLDPSATAFKNTCAIDVGANIGNHSLYFAERFGQVYSIEASPKTFGLLSFNVEHSGYSNITPIQAALGETAGKRMFAEHRNFVGSSGIIDPSNKLSGNLSKQPGRIFEVDVKTGDSVLSHYDMLPVSLIKIDVEGFERSVLAGLKHTIEAFHPMILMEQLSNEVQTGTSDTVELLRKWGYDKLYSPQSTSRIKGRRLRLLTKLLCGDTIELEAIDAFLPRHYPMVLCCASDSAFNAEKMSLTLPLEQ
jgi:FkbM family methyltransferase